MSNEPEYTKLRIVGSDGTVENLWASWVDKDKGIVKVANDPVVRNDIHFGDVVRMDPSGNFIEVVESGEYKTLLFWTPGENESGTETGRIGVARRLQEEYGCLCEPLTRSHVGISVPKDADMETVLAITLEAGWVEQERE